MNLSTSALLVFAFGATSVAVAQTPAAPRDIPVAEKECRIWQATNEEDSLVHGPTLSYAGPTVLYKVNGTTTDQDWGAHQTAVNCVARHLAGITALGQCRPKCLARGVETELAGEPIRKFLESDLRKQVTVEVKTQLDQFLADLKALNEAERKAQLEWLVQELPNQPDLIAALKNRPAPQKATPASAKAPAVAK